ncbi:hypothetical protein [Acinetobacter sp. G11]|uniref:hypothetical protein n=1 Tax=Acinetobacter sp. G11 TaxID=3415989 RepID=UPI003C7E9CCB
MGGSSGQVIGYQYFTNFLLFIGNPIEKVLGINFDKRGWINPLVEKNKSALSQGIINEPYLYGENEGGVAGVVHARYGTDDQKVVPFYQEYMESKGLQASAYPFQSYLAFKDFYVGNSGYMKEMLLWPKRIHVRNDGRPQWYDAKSEVTIYDTGSEPNLQYTGACGRHAYLDGYQVSSFSEDLNWTIHPDPNTYKDMRGVNANYRQYPPFNSDFPYTTASAKYVSQINSKGKVKVTGRVFVSAQTWNIYPVEGSDLIGEISVTFYDGTETTKDYLIEAWFDLTNTDKFGLQVDASGCVEDPGHLFKDLDAGIMWNYFYGPFPSDGILSGDINPIHKIREILTDDTAMNKPEASVNDVNFMKAADRIYDEGLGISRVFTEKNCLDAINEICYHIEAGIRVNRQTGLHEMVLFRDDWFEEDEIHTIPENKIKKGSMQYEITNADEVINQVNVNFYDQQNIKNSSFSISESGLIQTLGRVNAETVDFPYFMNMRNAEVVANWKLKILSTGVLKGSFTTGWREARKLNRYDLIRLPWSRRWAEPILVRIMNIKLGGPTSNEVSIEWVEVVPSTGMMNTTIVADDPVNTQPEVPKPCNAKVFELPYFEAVQALGEREVGIELADNPEAGYLCAIAEKPQNNSLNAALYADVGSGFERVATVNYCETAYLDQTIDRISSSFVVKNVGNIASVRVGSQIFINDEIMVYQSYDAETKVLIVKRGAFGVPQIHTANSILYFADDFVAVDQTLYVQSEIVNAKVLTTTPSGVLAFGDAFNHVVEFNARAIRPYPPANVKINGEYWPIEIETDLIITWVDRNRTQQTGGEIIGWYESGVTLESGVTYQLILIERDENEVELRTQDLSLGAINTYTFATSAMDANTRTIEITLKSLRDGYECLNPFIHTVELSQFFSAPYNIQYTVRHI